MLLTLDEMYKRIGLQPLLEWETAAQNEGGENPKGIGSSTHMIIEAAMDLSLLIRYGGKPRILVALDTNDIQRVHWIGGMIDIIVEHSGLNPPESEAYGIRIVTGVPGREIIRQADFVFVDHALIDPNRRLTGRIRMARGVREGGKPGILEILDRSNNVIEKSDDAGVNRILELSQCPVFDRRINLPVSPMKDPNDPWSE